MLDHPSPQARSATRARRVGAQPAVDVGDRGQPLVAQVSQIHRAVVGGPALRLPGQRRGSGAAAERVDQIGQRAGRAHDVDRPVGAEAYVVAVDQHRGVRGGQAEPARRRVRRDVVHVEQPARRVVLQPLPHVALVRAGPRGELARGRRTALVQRPVEPEPFAQIDGVELERPGGVAEEALGEGPGWIGHGLDDATLRRSVAPEGARDEHSAPTLPPRDDAGVLR